MGQRALSGGAGHGRSVVRRLGPLLAEGVAAQGTTSFAGYFTIILGALGTFPAVLSGLFMTKGVVMGHDALLFHHLFVWPAFACLVGLGTWRALVVTRSPFVASPLISWCSFSRRADGRSRILGGELILNS